MTWDILICSIWHRTEMLDALLEELERQRIPGVGIRVCWDNLDLEYGAKCQRLLESSTADYVCFIDDDDWIAPHYVQAIDLALWTEPDYVGFTVRYTEDGLLQVPVTHSLAWENRPDGLVRDIVHFNPIRRELALQGSWDGGNGADRRWADQVRRTGLVTYETWGGNELYHYRHRAADTFCAPREPLAEQPQRPDYPGVTWV